MKIYILLFFLHFSILGVSQSYEITYVMFQNQKKHNINVNLKCYLFGNGFYSLYEEDFENKKGKAKTSNSIESSDNETKLSLNSNPVYFKDFQLKSIYYIDMIKLDPFYIHDKLGSIKWNIENETKTILNFKCQKASCIYNGRKFEVFFTEDIPINDGPWKLTGLPGLILQVYSDDNVASFKITVEKIEIKNDVVKLENPFVTKKLLTFDEFKAIYQKKYDESQHKIIDNHGSTRPMAKGFKEYFVE
ncbi:MAG: GLPGLI family protein [Flavobacterium sp.]